MVEYSDIVETPQVRIDTKELARDLIDNLFGAGAVSVLVIKDPHEQEVYANAHRAFSVLHDILWGKFYDQHIDHGDCSKFTTPDEAVQAYREFIADCIEEAGIGGLI